MNFSGAARSRGSRFNMRLAESIVDIQKSDAEKLLAEKGMAFTSIGTARGSSQRLAREYLDSLSLEMRVIDAPVSATTRCAFFDASFSTPVMVTALSALNAIRSNGMVEVAKGAAAAGAAMLVGVGDNAELSAIIDTGVKAIKIIKPYRDLDLIFKNMEHAQSCGAFAVGMDICFGFGMKNGFASASMSPKSLDEIRQLIAATSLPFILKGILSKADAKKALAAGASGMMVSHQGGTVVDFAVPPVKVLPHIRDAAGERFPVFVDCAILTGTDVFKALALGANGAGIGKAAMLGLATDGADGVRRVIEEMTEELRRVMCLTGAEMISDIDDGVIWM